MSSVPTATAVSVKGLVPPQTESKIEELAVLQGISQALSRSSNLKESLHLVLEILERSQSVIRSSVTLLQEDSEELHIEAASGLSHNGRRARYHLGEGITGRVVQSGKPIVVPQISREPLFLNRADQRKELKTQELTFVLRSHLQ